MKWTYLALLLVVSAALTIAASHDPYGASFTKRLVPFLVALYLLQWLAIPLKPMYRLCGFLASLLVVVVLFTRFDLQRVAFPKLLVGLLIAVAAYIILFRELAAPSPIRNIFVAQSLAATFILLVGLYISSRGIHFDIATDEGFLLWSPLAAMLFWILGSMFRWTKSTRILFVITLGSIAIGLLDVGAGQHLVVMTGLSVVFLISALVFLIRWADVLYPSRKNNPTTQP